MAMSRLSRRYHRPKKAFPMNGPISQPRPAKVTVPSASTRMGSRPSAADTTESQSRDDATPSPVAVVPSPVRTEKTRPMRRRRRRRARNSFHCSELSVLARGRADVGGAAAAGRSGRVDWWVDWCRAAAFRSTWRPIAAAQRRGPKDRERRDARAADGDWGVVAAGLVAARRHVV